ncbi:hypothetical protein RYX36_035040 [Vicia faba]
MLSSDKQDFKSNYTLTTDDVPFSDSFFVKDDLLQGNGLSWVLPDSDVDIRRLVRKTHKGEFQMEVEHEDNVPVEKVSGGKTSVVRRQPVKKDVKATSSSKHASVIKRDVIIDEEKSNIQTDNQFSITMASNDGTDPMQGSLWNYQPDLVFGFSTGGPNGSLVVAGCESQVLLWDWRNNKQIACLEDPHMDDVTQVHFVPDEPGKLISASVDGLIYIFDTSGDINDDDHLDSVINVGTSIAKAKQAVKAKTAAKPKAKAVVKPNVVSKAKPVTHLAITVQIQHPVQQEIITDTSSNLHHF